MFTVYLESLTSNLFTQITNISNSLNVTRRQRWTNKKMYLTIKLALEAAMDTRFINDVTVKWQNAFLLRNLNLQAKYLV